MRGTLRDSHGGERVLPDAEDGPTEPLDVHPGDMPRAVHAAFAASFPRR